MDVIMPQLGETVRSGTVAVWYKKAGDAVKADEPLFEVETDKVTMEIPAPAAGVVSEILVEAGVEVKVGARLAVISTGESASAPAAQVAAVVSAAASATAAPVPERCGSPLPRSGPGGPKLSPVVRRLLGEHGIAPERIAGSGANGRITREDVLAYLNRIASAEAPSSVPGQKAHEPAAPMAPGIPVAPAEQPAPVAGIDDLIVPLNKVRRVTAAHMVRSKLTSPHTLQAMEVDFHAVDKARSQAGAEWKAKEGHSLTYLPFIARAVCDAIAKFPYVNASFGNDELIVHKRIHMGIAVDVNFEGLLAPVVRDAHHRNLRGLSAEIRRVAESARHGTLKPDELAGGTYTISNSGTFGTYFSASIINQPQAAILSVDGVHKKPVVIESDDADMIGIRPIGVLAQSFDHRAFDGAYNAAFLKCLKEIIEDRDWLAEIA